MDHRADRTRAVGIIAARMASTRFPGKPLAPILGRPMIEHVFRRARACASLDEVVVATCDEAIKTAAEAFGARVIMTSNRHERAMERIAEAATHVDGDIMVLVQGDEPMLVPSSLDDLVTPLRQDPTLLCTNLMIRIETERDARDPDQVKVVCDLKRNAVYMSREPLPTFRYGADVPRWRQIGLIAFRKPFLLELTARPSTPLERAESVDMLRAIEHGLAVRMVPMREMTYAVDTPGDIARVEQLMRADPAAAAYL